MRTILNVSKEALNAITRKTIDQSLKITNAPKISMGRPIQQVVPVSQQPASE